MSALPDHAFAAALAGLPRLHPARLRALMSIGPVAEVWSRVAAGDRSLVAAVRIRPWRPGDPDDATIAGDWQRHARARTPERVWERCARVGVDVLVVGDPRYPALLETDAARPAVLFAKGDLGALDGPRCAVVGTRRATRAGLDMALLFGAGLARHGVRVVSGLALGIDGAAHRAALADSGAPPIGVVASGLDVAYPRSHADLWDAVAARGVLLSEVPPGTSALAERFPWRNRILAALSDVVVVVESRASGGSLHTAREALRRDIPVLAVPGSPRNPAAAGTNALLRDGATPAVDVIDALVALGFRRPRTPRVVDERPRPSPADAEVLALFAGEALTLDDVVIRLRRSIFDVAAALGRLEAAGWVVRSGQWFEEAGPRVKGSVR